MPALLGSKCPSVFIGSGGDLGIFLAESFLESLGLRLRGLARLLSGSEDSGDSAMDGGLLTRPLRFLVVLVK